MRKTILGLSLVLLLTSAGLSQKLRSTQTVRSIAFGSCAVQDRPQPIWDTIRRARPDLFLLLGDNIYADTEDMTVMRRKYDLFASIPAFQRFRRRVPILATWDDHDYGLNDGGADYPKRAESQKVFLDFFGEPQDSPRREREGVYDAKIFGPASRRVQIILLDTRYFRSPLKRIDPPDESKGRYVSDKDASKTILGDAQWRWLGEQLRIAAEVRIIVSSIQVVAENHGWEKWMNISLERERLFKLIRETKAEGVIFISGDRHLAELSMMDAGVGYPIYDLTSSALNNSSQKWRRYELNRHRVATMNWGDNFGLIEIDWTRKDPRISLQIRDIDGDITIQQKILLSTLRPGMIK